MKYPNQLKALLLAASVLFYPASALAQLSVTTAKLDEVAQYPLRFAPATVVSLNQPAVSARISADVIDVPVRVGDQVDRGDLLVALNCEDYELNRAAAAASLEATRTRLALARTQLARTERLVADQLVSTQELDASRTELEALTANLTASQAQLDISELQISRCEIRAPFDGLVTARTVSVGQLVSPGTPLVQLLDLDSLELSAQIFNSDALLLDQVDELWFDTGTGSYPVKLQALVNALDPATRNREARLIFEASAAMAGASGKLQWNDPRPHLPAQYQVERNGRLGFFVIENGKAHFVELKDAQPGRSNPVTLPLDAHLVVDGFAGLIEGDPVNEAPRS